MGEVPEMSDRSLDRLYVHCLILERLATPERPRAHERLEAELGVELARRLVAELVGRSGLEGTYREHVKARLSTDGGARGNPGPAAYGYVLEADDGTVLDARGEAIGVATNNVAEYRALLAGLRKAIELGVDEVDVVSDSELLVKQMRGEYRVKNAALRELSLEAASLARRLRRVTYTAVRREHNELADKLVNQALDALA